MKNSQEFCEKLIAYVKRSAAPELRETRCAGNQEKWFMVWSSGLTSELAEFINTTNITDATLEAGDILWTIGALCIMLDLDPMNIFDWEPSDRKDDITALLRVIQLQGHAEKVVREGTQRREICPARTLIAARVAYGHFQWRVTPEDALNAVIAKLDKRYPNGFDPDRSAERVV
jgi:NTP pyrophosphatase (non-canonical NTP hydrolase)